MDCVSSHASAKEEILQAMPGIIEAIIKKAQSGSYLHANFLFVFAGVGEVEDTEDNSREESLTERLMRELDDIEPATETAGVKSPGEASQDESAQHP